MDNFKDDIDKELQILTQSKGQLEASINKVEKHLTIDEYKDYCDALYTCITYNQQIQKTLRDRVNIFPLVASDPDDDLPF